MKEHEIRELVNKMRDIAKQFYAHQSLRERIAQVLVPVLNNHVSANTHRKTEWVPCPICGEPDMRKETDEEGNSLIFCVNHACKSNGGNSSLL
jgi:hypothetical protein